MASLFKSTSVAATRTPFWETWLEKSVTAYLNFPETSGTPWIRHSDLAGIIVFSLANTEHNFECFLSSCPNLVLLQVYREVKFLQKIQAENTGIGDVSYVDSVLEFSASTFNCCIQFPAYLRLFTISGL
ncbi:hypothetical protein AVEN_260283-1 [Araneus ventricosus]|uniref:Uncharacterized protein n=1 Tax=Araneus ventricosus TaxID=182803 RepID=A0A4Y2CPM6_ARAVE|nr:hypothetical protein AVEN_83856-1 [Araneus ventricosus]GBM06391.1 hypothetical protein AVEN_269047-1 [Araneus ventricosus]GBM06438.1 hypothetical protein AVEN_133553-1 [Araneus ventricosus]GBM06450.1 hypothetical protein AVEN_152090-1 [Araneus ventricosus]GBN63123.1 hypothetical protein AVEN_260283-1 [Araneus ventricosus]